MELEEGWLERQLMLAKKTVESWPPEMQERYKKAFDLMVEESRAEAEYRFARRHDPKHGNF